MVRYRKIIEEGTFEHRFYESLGFPPASGGGGMSFVLRITLDDMELLDGFYMSLPADVSSLSIEDAIRKYVLCEDEEDRLKVKHRLSKDPNPDLLDIYDDLLYLYQQAEAGKVTLSYHINNGASDIEPTDPVSLHQQLCSAVPLFEKGVLGGISVDGSVAGTYRLLDLVLEVYDNLDPFSGLTDEQKDSMLRDFRRIFILYCMDKFDYQPRLQSTRHKEDARYDAQDARQQEDVPRLESQVLSLEPSIDYLASEDVGLIRIQEECVITPRGYDLLSSIIDEAEFYIGNYDIFGDVYVKGVSEIRFNAGHGDNLIVPVFIREGIDPYRALFIVALYLGNMDYLVQLPAYAGISQSTKSDLSMLFSEDPFEELFSLIACSPTVEDIGTELLDRIIREGKLRAEKQKLREARLEHIESINRRIGVISDP